VTTTVFFRDDDVRSLDPLCRVASVLLEADAACSYQVIPAHLDEATAAELRALRASHPDRVFLNQHGLHHEQQVGGERRWSEFDAGRPAGEQRAAIAEGRRRLEDRLGDAFDGDVFTPPAHKYDARTLEALAELGFTVLSAGVRVDAPSRLYYGLGRRLGRVDWLGRRVSYHDGPTPVPGLAEVSVCIDVDEDTDRSGRRLEKDAAALWREFEAARRVLPCVGVMLHHERYGEPGRLAGLEAFLKRLKETPDVRFATLPECAARARGSTA
jgi:hypothetical protein